MTDQSYSEVDEPEKGGFFSHKAVRGVPWMLLGKMVLFFVYLAISVVTVNGLGREKFGIFSLMSNISSYLLVVCGLGLGAALNRYIPELAARRNRKALVHLLSKSAALQILAVTFCALLLPFVSSPLQRLFNAEHVEHFNLYLKLACALTALLLLKDFVANVFTSLYETRFVALLSITQGCILLGILSVWLYFSPQVGTALLSQIAALSCVYFVGVYLVIKHIRQLDWFTDEFGIGKIRALKFSGTAMLGAILRLVMFKYSEVFFLAAVGGTTLAGLYDLSYSLPYTMVTFIPLAILPLATAAFAEAYVKDHNCLGRLINSYYKLLISVSLPVAILGSFFAPTAYHIIYRGEVDEAGNLAAAFCLVLLLPLVSIPLSMALKAKERVHSMLPMMMLQIIVNLILDWLLIVEFKLGVWGGVWAVLGTFMLTIVPRMLVVRRIIGGIYFPVAFLVRIAATLIVLAAVIHWVTARYELFEQTDHFMANLFLLFAVGGVYLFLFLVLVRLLRLIRPDDVADLKTLQLVRLNKMMKWMFGV